MAISRAVVYCAQAPTHLVQELNVGTVLNCTCTCIQSCTCDVSMLNVYSYGIHILETNGVLLEI